MEWLNNDGTDTQWSTLQLLKKNEADLYELIWCDFQDPVLNEKSKVKIYL